MPADCPLVCIMFLYSGDSYWWIKIFIFAERLVQNAVVVVREAPTPKKWFPGEILTTLLKLNGIVHIVDIEYAVEVSK